MVEATRQDKIFMVGEISMFSCNIWTVIDAKLSEIFSKVAELSSVGLSMIDICHYLQLNSVRGRFIISRFASKGKMNQLLLLQSWLLFKYAELKLVVRQTDHIFVLVENNICVDTVDVKILKSFQRQDLQVNLTMSTQMMHYISMQKMNQQYWEIKLLLVITS